MTNKEAIANLNHIYGIVSPDIQRSFDLAIEALEERSQGKWIEPIITLFNKYDVLLVHEGGQIVPVKNTTKQDCYDLLYEIQELIEWRKILFNKNLNDVYKEGEQNA